MRTPMVGSRNAHDPWPNPTHERVSSHPNLRYKSLSHERPQEAANLLFATQESPVLYGFDA